MEKYDDRIDGYNKSEYEMLAQAYVEARNDCTSGEGADRGQINCGHTNDELINGEHTNSARVSGGGNNGDHANGECTNNKPINGKLTNEKRENAATDWHTKAGNARQDDDLQNTTLQTNSTTKKTPVPQIFGKNKGVEPTQSASAPEDGCAPTAFNNSHTQNNLRTGTTPSATGSSRFFSKLFGSTADATGNPDKFITNADSVVDNANPHAQTRNNLSAPNSNSSHASAEDASQRSPAIKDDIKQGTQREQDILSKQGAQRNQEAQHEQEFWEMNEFQGNARNDDLRGWHTGGSQGYGTHAERDFAQENSFGAQSGSFGRHGADEVQPLIEPTPQVSYKGLNEYETAILNDLVQDLNQYFKDDFGLSEYLDEVKVIERPLLYFVSRSRMLSKLMALLCSIYEKSRLSKELHSLVALLIIAARTINAAR